ncbi:NADPH-dependent FMN reductase [Paramicrobacterium fandaimingii]|uniref:NADPH-dependent FMN reductase n=1 Tax=Paramicrobacterium fandaimingii TaxID=2708079 RepID=UPI001F46EB9D|nr:NAD(P)H-dependent oxidoreductase [Microbacterium fandaimingii]
MDEPNHTVLGQYTREHTKKWSARVAACDAIIFVQLEYNYSFAPSLKNARDYLHREAARKPVGTANADRSTRSPMSPRYAARARKAAGVVPSRRRKCRVR